jgi:hypothetical protein
MRKAMRLHTASNECAADGQVDALELCLATRMESETVRLTYRGSPRGIGVLAQMMEEQGVSVRYTPPQETRDMAGALAIVPQLAPPVT